MKESEILDIIKHTLSDSSYIGDDCAYLKDFGLYITQDSLVEGVHFNLSYMTPYQLGIKSVAVNVSDICASLSTPVFITVGLSLPKTTDAKFVEELYRGINFACLRYNVKVAGGDITGSDKVVVSITAIGKERKKLGVSRKFAGVGDYIVTTGYFGSASAGLYSLENNLPADKKLIRACLTPEARLNESLNISDCVDCNIAVTDCSDSLIESLFRVAELSGVSIGINYNDIPVLSEVRDFSEKYNLDEKDFVLWGGEDYELILFVNKRTFLDIDKNIFTCIGKAEEKTDNPSVIVRDKGVAAFIDKQLIEKKSFNHFGG